MIGVSSAWNGLFVAREDTSELIVILFQGTASYLHYRANEIEKNKKKAGSERTVQIVRTKTVESHQSDSVTLALENVTRKHKRVMENREKASIDTANPSKWYLSQ